MRFTPNQLAFKSPALPCNPLPLLNELIEETKKQGTGFIKTDAGKMLLWTINAIAYGDLATIDQVEEFNKLSNVVHGI